MTKILFSILAVLCLGLSTTFAQVAIQTPQSTFIAQKDEGNSVRLDWAVSDEKNNELYEIQRSIDGQHFERVGQIYAYNKAGYQNYVFIDRNALIGDNHYRFALIDQQDKIHYSPVQSIRLANEQIQAALTPDFNHQKFDLTLHLKKTAQLKVEVLNRSDEERMLLLHNGPITAGKHQIGLPARDLKAGNFMVRIEGDAYKQDMQLILL